MKFLPDNKDWHGRYHYVLWSGGLDSTCLLHEVAGKYGTRDQEVYAISVASHPCIDKNKEAAESRARERYLRHAKSTGRHIIPFVVSVQDCPPVTKSRGPDQAWIWLLHSMGYIWDNSVLHMGYVQEDQIWHYKYELKQLFNSIVAIKGYDVTLDMPYEWITKSDILSMQEAEIPSNCVWHCESPKKVGRGYKACGACYSCRTHDLAIYKRESWGIGNRDISES